MPAANSQRMPSATAAPPLNEQAHRNGERLESSPDEVSQHRSICQQDKDHCSSVCSSLQGKKVMARVTSLVKRKVINSPVIFSAREVRGKQQMLSEAGDSRAPSPQHTSATCVVPNLEKIFFTFCPSTSGKIKKLTFPGLCGD